jgi:uncharacterized membrane protein (UPF0127 family)
MAQWYRVSNPARGTVLAERCRVARSMRDRTVGLLGTSALGAGQGLWIERSPSIHMFFMRYPIDAVFVDADDRVVRVVERLRPWRIVAWVRGARDCIELPAGSVSGTGTVAGDPLVREPLAEAADPG